MVPFQVSTKQMWTSRPTIVNTASSFVHTRVQPLCSRRFLCCARVCVPLCAHVWWPLCSHVCIPKQTDDVTPIKMLMFDFHIKEKISITLYSCATFVSIYLFASAQEAMELHDMDDKEIDIFDRFEEDLAEAESQEIVVTQSETITALKITMFRFVVFSCALVAASAAFNRAKTEKIVGFFSRVHVEVTSPNTFSIAPLYVKVLYGILSCIVSMHIAFIVYVTTGNMWMSVKLSM